MNGRIYDAKLVNKGSDNKSSSSDTKITDLKEWQFKEQGEGVDKFEQEETQEVMARYELVSIRLKRVIETESEGLIQEFDFVRNRMEILERNPQMSGGFDYRKIC